MSDIIYMKGKNDKDISLWDDTALMEAYDLAVQSFKNSTATTDKDFHLIQDCPPKNKKKQKKKNGGIRWKIGARCQTHYSEDGLLYDAIIVSINSKKGTCRVKYLHYDNEEEKQISDLIKVDTESEEPTLTPPPSSFPELFPHFPPPPMPDATAISTEKDALYGMLISWYMSGYYTGYYKGLQGKTKT